MHIPLAFKNKVVTLSPILESEGAKQVSVLHESGGDERRTPPGKNRFNTYIMYAIVEINGQQFKVEQGKKLFVNHIQNAESGQTVEFEKVMLVDNNGAITVGAPLVKGAKVVCEVVDPLIKGDKVLIFHKKRRKGYRKLNGYRHQFTQISVKEVIA